VRIYDEAGAFVWKREIVLDAQGYAEIRCPWADANGYLLKPGVYWVLGSGGGVRAKRLFVVVRGGGR
jgi:hypothetical protein